MKCDLGYEDAAIPLVGIEPSESEERVIYEIYKNYFSLVGDETPSKKLSRDIYKMISSKYMNKAIRYMGEDIDNVTGDMANSILESNDPQGREVFASTEYWDLRKKISRYISGIGRITTINDKRSYSSQFLETIPLPVNKKGLLAIKYYFLDNNHHYYHGGGGPINIKEFLKGVCYAKN